MTAQVDDVRHPVVAAVVGLRSELSALAATPVWTLSTADTEAALLEVTALATQAAQLQLRLLAHAERVNVGQSVGATSAANWFAHTTRTVRPAAHRAVRLAGRLDQTHPAVDTALAQAVINVEQAAVIVSAVDALPDTVATETVEQAEAFLLREARDHDARDLRILGRRLLEVLDPEAADAEEARRLEPRRTHRPQDRPPPLPPPPHPRPRPPLRDDAETRWEHQLPPEVLRLSS